MHFQHRELDGERCPKLGGVQSDHGNSHQGLYVELLEFAADCLVRILAAVRAGEPLRAAILSHASDWILGREGGRLEQGSRRGRDRPAIESACYIPDAFPAALYLAWKYADDFGAGICANAQVGGG